MSDLSAPSGRVDRPVVNFEVPSSAQVPDEMEQYVDWLNRTRPDTEKPLLAFTRTGLSHLYFENIHPFEDGNGRLGRALSEKSLAQNIGQPSLIALAFTIARKRKDYSVQLDGTDELQSFHFAWLEAYLVLEPNPSLDAFAEQYRPLGHSKMDGDQALLRAD